MHHGDRLGLLEHYRMISTNGRFGLLRWIARRFEFSPQHCQWCDVLDAFLKILLLIELQVELV